MTTRLLAGMGAAAIAVGALTTATSTATADVPHQAKLCMEGDYGNYVASLEIPQQGGISTGLPLSPIPAGGVCESIGLQASTTWAKVYGYYNNSGGRFFIETVHFTYARGWTGAAGGTTTAPYVVHFG